MRMRDTVKFVPLTLTVLLLVPAYAWAFSVQATASATAGGGTSESQNSGVLVNTPSASVSALSSGASTSASAASFAAPGTLGTVASSASGSSSSGGATAQALAAFTDTLTLLSATPGFSGPVMLGFSLNVAGVLEGCLICPAQANVSSSLSVGSGGTYVNGISSVTYARSFIGGSASLTPIPTLPQIVLTTMLNDEISLSGNLSVFTGVDGIGSSATADYSRTSNFYVDVLTPGVTLISASGVNYATPASAVPEPGTFALAVSGVLLLLEMMRRRRRRLF